MGTEGLQKSVAEPEAGLGDWGVLRGDVGVRRDADDLVRAELDGCAGLYWKDYLKRGARSQTSARSVSKYTLLEG